LADEGEEIKEVYAHFGLAYYLAGVFETGLALSILKLDFLKQQRKQAELRKGIPFDRSIFNARYDEFLGQQHAQTLGNLIKRLGALIDVPEGMQGLLSRAKQRRDFIAHHFFRERAESFQTRRGRKKMLEELQADQQLFEEADRELEKLLRPHEEAIGINKEKLQAYVDQYMASIENEEALDP